METDPNVIPDETKSRSGIQWGIVFSGFSAAGGLRDFRNDGLGTRTHNSDLFSSLL